jgi:hypothetical protein
MVSLENRSIFTKLGDVQRRLIRLSGTRERRQQVENIFQSVLRELYRANEESIGGMFQVDAEICKCDSMIVGLGFSWWEGDWYRNQAS